MKFEGVVTKLKVLPGEPVQYYLGDLCLNQLVGKTIALTSRVEKRCIHCDRPIKKTFGQGFCFPCFQKLARCDSCIVRPELCHYYKGTCREPEWGEQNCLIEHTVYLAATSSVKVGITRSHQQLTRWIDQGADSAIELGRVPGRLRSGLVETRLKELVTDKTNWRHLLTGQGKEIDLLAEKARVRERFPTIFAEQGGAYSDDVEPLRFQYPVVAYLAKARSINLDKTPEVRGVLKGIRGQYLFVGEAGLNVRKYQGYVWSLVAQ